MAELELDHEGAENDPTGKRVGVLAAVLAVILAIVTIESHRTHTAAIIFKTEESDQWNFYQAKKMKSHNVELGGDLISLLAPKDDAAAAKRAAEYRSEIQRYEQESKEISDIAQEKEKEALHAEHQALRFDIGEGLLEIALVLSSLYFISRRLMFPAVGIVAGGIGIAVAISGLLVQ